MSALAHGGYAGFVVGLGETGAGEFSSAIVRQTFGALMNLKGGAGPSMVFNELNLLSAEGGEARPHDNVFLLAQRLLLSLPTHLPPPELSLDTDGEIVFDWMGSGNRMFTMTLRGDGRLSYAARISDTDKDHGTKAYLDSIPSVVLDLVQKVTSH